MRPIHGLLLFVNLVQPTAVFVVLPRARPLDAVVELVVGGQQVAVLRHSGEQLGVGADMGDGPVLEQGDLVGEQHGRRPVCDDDAGDVVQHTP